MDIAKLLDLPCGARLSNRLAKGAMTEGLATAQGMPTPELERLYALWSNGGAGMLLTGNVQIDRDHLERPGNVIIYKAPDAAMRGALTRWAKAGTQGGNHLWMQISHAGRQTQALINPTPKAPSAVKLGLPGGQFGEPVALTEKEIEDLIGRFAVVATAARETGFTGVQVHGAHGYLISQFLSPRSNVRTDAWGGSLENRARFLMEAVKRVRAAVGADFPVSVKLNSADFQRGGFAFEESLVVAQWLQEAGVDLLEISGGSYEQPAMMDMEGLEPAARPDVAASTAQREAYFVDFAKAMKAKLSMPLMVTGGFRTARAMNHAIESGGADVIGIGRPMCADVDAPKKLLAGAASIDRWEDKLRLFGPMFGWLKAFKMFRAIDGFAVQYWYYAQLYALGRTGKADPAMKVMPAWQEVERTHKTLAAQR
ncbi:MAG: NADH:flavin oxidoreductase/NADH oxidase family protein [Alphaproteobacteria bacterium]|nr:NADH:flavin oxidoreductase/NADH oxidase family protein [Alphaproteobacteria bacterium]